MRPVLGPLGGQKLQSTITALEADKRMVVVAASLFPLSAFGDRNGFGYEACGK
jgi:hypothetical protein